MKKIFSSAIAIMLLIGAANAQTGNNEKTKDKKENHQKSLKEAGLSGDQESKIKSINENYRKQASDLKAKNLSDEELKAEREALHKKHKAEIGAVLTADQKIKLSDNRKEYKKNKGDFKNDSISRGKINGLDKDKRGEGKRELAADLNLSKEQKIKVKSIRESYKAKGNAVRNDATLSKEIRKEKIKELMKAQQEEMKTVLTPEQQTKLKSNRKKGATTK